MREAVVAGVGMDRFGRFPDKTYLDHGVAAASAALADAGISWRSIGALFCGACNLGAVPGNRIADQFGANGCEIVNVDNASASGSSAFRLAVLAVAEGRCEAALALGIGKMDRDTFADPRRMLGGGEYNVRSVVATGQINAATVFGLLARRRMHERGTTDEVFGRIAVKSHHAGARNPYAHFQTEITLEQHRTARLIADPLRLYDCCPTSDGGAAAVVTTRELAEQLDRHPVVRVLSSTAKSDVDDLLPYAGEPLTRAAAEEAYKQAGVGPEDLDLFQVHDAFSAEELDYYEALRICDEGDAEKLVYDGDVALGGRIPCNTDGGLLSRGHPLGPTGLAQVWETTLQLRGQAGDRQVDGARTGLCHMLGAGEVCIIHILQSA